MAFDFQFVILKLTMIVSVLLFGYNLSMFFNSYSFFSEKAVDYRELMRLGGTQISKLRFMNVILLCVLFLFYMLLLFSVSVSNVVLVAVLIKFLISLYYSDRFQVVIVKDSSISKSLYWQIKLDSLLNILGSLFLSILLVKIQ